MKKLTGPYIGLHFIRNKRVVIDTTQGLIQLPHLTMQVKTASNEPNSNPQAVLTDGALTILPRTTKTITAFVDHPSEWSTTGTVTPLEKFTKTASLLISHSMSTLIDNNVAIRVTNTTESPYSLKRNTQIAEFSVVFPEQSEYVKMVYMAILSMIPEANTNLTTYLNDLLRMKKLEQQNNTFWFPTPENPGKPEDHTPTQTGTLRKSLELKKNRKSPHKTTQSLEKSSSNDLVALIHFYWKLKNELLKIFWLTIKTFSPDREWRVGWTRSLRWNWAQKTIKLYTAKINPCLST